jgi:glycerol-3-phosphate dehydrogenase
LIDDDPALTEKLHKRLPYKKVEVLWAVRYEMAQTVEDVLARRVRALFLDARAAIDMAPEVARIMAKEMDKSSDWEQDQVKEFTSLAANYLLVDY